MPPTNNTNFSTLTNKAKSLQVVKMRNSSSVKNKKTLRKDRRKLRLEEMKVKIARNIAEEKAARNLQSKIRGRRTRKNLKKTKTNQLINLPSNRLKKTQDIRIDISREYLTNISDADIDVISIPSDSGSYSVVFKITDRNTKFIYILKVMLDKYNNNIAFKTEEENYKTMKNILSKRLTPHVFTFIDSKTFESSDIIDKELKFRLEPILSNADFDNIKKYYILLTETSDYKLMTLDDFLETDERYFTSNYILYNILFQIMYTLYIFNKLKIKHNDLHFGNIMVSFAKENILEPSFKIKYNNIYHFNGKRVCLPNIGISVRIFDFDRTTKAVTDSYGKKTCNTLISEDDYLSELQNCEENKYHDTYKVLFHLYDYSFNINDWIESLFNDNIYISKPDERNNEMDPKYGFLYTGVDATMKPTKEILEKIVTEIEKEDTFRLKGNVITYYDPKRPISGEYHEDGINGIKSFYKEQKNQKKSQKELNNNIIAFQQQLVEENNE